MSPAIKSNICGAINTMEEFLNHNIDTKEPLGVVVSDVELKRIKDGKHRFPNQFMLSWPFEKQIDWQLYRVSIHLQSL